MKTESQVIAQYNATEEEACSAAENAVMLLQDEYGFEAVTAKRALSEDGDLYSQFIELFESSLEGMITDKTFR